jgi:hypothetical protein
MSDDPTMPPNDPPRADDEIEVTKAMIEAGATELASYSYNLFNEDEVLAAIFRAMLAASQGAVSEDESKPFTRKDFRNTLFMQHRYR